MATVFAGIPGVVIYLDDSVAQCPPSTMNASIGCSPVTTSNRPCNIDVVGLHLTAADLAPLQSNMEAIQRLPDPTCLAQVALFLGMTAYYLRSLPSTPQKRSTPWGSGSRPSLHLDMRTVAHVCMQAANVQPSPWGKRGRAETEPDSEERHQSSPGWGLPVLHGTSLAPCCTTKPRSSVATGSSLALLMMGRELQLLLNRELTQLRCHTKQHCWRGWAPVASYTTCVWRVCMCVRERVCVCVCVCVWESEGRHVSVCISSSRFVNSKSISY